MNWIVWTETSDNYPYNRDWDVALLDYSDEDSPWVILWAILFVGEVSQNESLGLEGLDT